MSAAPRIAAAVAAAAVVGGVVVLGGGAGGSGARGPEVGKPLPEFAAPLAASDLVGDANISPQACALKDRRAVVSCRAAGAGAVMVGFIDPGDRRCARLPAAMASASRSIGGIEAIAVGIRGERAPLRALAAATPGVDTVWDRDGGLTNRYGVAVCPTVVVARKGGVVAGVLLGEGVDDAAVLESKVRGLLGRG